MSKKSAFQYLSLVTLSSLLAACGGGGGGGGSTPTPTKPSSVAASSSSVAVSSSTSVTSSSATSSSSSAPSVPTMIKLNQVGYKPFAEKLAVVPGVAATTFAVKDANDAVVLTGNLSSAQTWAPSYESVKLADFSALEAEGTYTLSVDGVQNSASFKISDTAYDALNAGAIKAYYYNRAGIDLLEQYAGVYKRALGHADTSVIVHKSAETPAHPEGSIISAPKGWYDAGDYNLYIVNSGISTYTLLAAYEKYTNYFKAQNLNIPESGNGVPDVLNEAMWNLDWMLSMQDEFGGVYHKLTSKNFSGFVMPNVDTSERYVVGRSTASALDFAAVMAAASRIYAPYNPSKSTDMLNAALRAWTWAKVNPNIKYIQPSDIFTGGYDDSTFTDEFAWAAAELYLATNDNTYLTEFKSSSAADEVPSWQSVKVLGWISLAHNIDSILNVEDKTLIKTHLDAIASAIASKKPTSAYGVPLTSGDFYWGSNSGALNKAMMLMVAYELDSTKKDYLKTAQSLLDYVLGRNATDYSFVTGFGVRYPQNVHHRPSASDTVAGSIPGFLAGGPNASQDDKANCKTANKAYPSTIAAKSYLDDVCSYASNEIAINWNAPLVYVSAALQNLTE